MAKTLKLIGFFLFTADMCHEFFIDLADLIFNSLVKDDTAGFPFLPYTILEHFPLSDRIKASFQFAN